MEPSTVGRLRATARSVLDRIFPWACVACARPARSALCGQCLDRVRWISDPFCPCCGLPLASSPSHLCGRCAAERPAFSRLRGIACYHSAAEGDDPLGVALRALKYGRRRALAQPLSEILAERFPFAAADYDVAVPAPLHITRLRERGFNQASLLARETARRFALRLDPELLVRLKPTSPQVGLGEAERRRNVRGAFAVRAGRSAAGLRVLLVDDVCTSTATATACARALLAGGAEAVDVVCLARALAN